jgi:hypothetical protein
MKRRSPMQVSIEAILDAAGRREEFTKALLDPYPQQGFHMRLEQPGYMRLVIEVVTVNEVSVAHYFEQNGDLMRDPEIVFLVHPTHGFLPVEITQDPVGRFRRADAGNYLRGVMELARVWGSNLRAQGWVDVAAASTTAAKEVRT